MGFSWLHSDGCITIVKTNIIASIISLALFGTLAHALIELPTNTSRLTSLVTANLDESGVSNPVTAVLLNFRSYDTLLEMGVLLLALIGAWAVGPRQTLPGHSDDTAMLIVLRLFVPPIILGAAYFLWVGAKEPGGAFQAGAILAGALVLLLITGRATWFHRDGWHRFFLSIGMLVFLSLAAAPMAMGSSLLDYPRSQAKHWILIIETAAMLSIAFTLVALLVGGRPHCKEIAD